MEQQKVDLDALEAALGKILRPPRVNTTAPLVRPVTRGRVVRFWLGKTKAIHPHITTWTISRERSDIRQDNSSI